VTQIILVCPGRTDYDDQQRIQGVLDVPLNDVGRVETARWAEQLVDQNIQCLYSSRIGSAAATAEAIGRDLGVPSRKIDELRNIDHGLWQGLRVEDLRRQHRKAYRQWLGMPTRVCPPEGETVNSAFERAEACLAKLIRRHRGETIALVCPEPFASVVRCWLRQGDPDQVWSFAATNGGWEVLRASNGQG